MRDGVKNMRDKVLARKKIFYSIYGSYIDYIR